MVDGAPVVVMQTTSLGHLATLPVLIGERDCVLFDLQVHNSVQAILPTLRMLGVPCSVVPHARLDRVKTQAKALACFRKSLSLSNMVCSFIKSVHKCTSQRHKYCFNASFCACTKSQQEASARPYHCQMDWQAARVSLLLALTTAALLLPLGLWLGRWLAFTAHPAKPWCEALLLLPLLLPPTVIGFYWLLTFGQNTAFGSWLRDTLGLRLVFSFWGLLLASLLINLPFMVQPIQRAFAGIEPSVREAAWVGGLSPWQTLLKIELPLAAPGVLAGIALTIAHTLGEFGVVLMVGGSVAGETRTLSIAIYDRVQAFDEIGAHVMAAALVFCALAALVAVFAGERRRRSA